MDAAMRVEVFLPPLEDWSEVPRTGTGLWDGLGACEERFEGVCVLTWAGLEGV